MYKTYIYIYIHTHIKKRIRNLGGYHLNFYLKLDLFTKKYKMNEGFLKSHGAMPPNPSSFAPILMCPLFF